VPEAVLDAVAPITPGKLLGLEMHMVRIDAEEDLRMIANMSAAFSGGDEARRYVQSLHDRLGAAQEYATGPAAVAERREREKAAKRAEIAAFAARLG
jgi:plasmid stabilization system protein ParE